MPFRWSVPLWCHFWRHTMSICLSSMIVIFIIGQDVVQVLHCILFISSSSATNKQSVETHWRCCTYFASHQNFPLDLVTMILVWPSFCHYSCKVMIFFFYDFSNPSAASLFFPLKDLFIYLSEKEREHTSGRGRGRGRENLKLTPHWAWSLTWGSVPRSWNHDLSQKPRVGCWLCHTGTLPGASSREPLAIGKRPPLLDQSIYLLSAWTHELYAFSNLHSLSYSYFSFHFVTDLATECFLKLAPGFLTSVAFSFFLKIFYF